jgi:hypothetical protein
VFRKGNSLLNVGVLMIAVAVVRATTNYSWRRMIFCNLGRLREGAKVV